MLKYIRGQYSVNEALNPAPVTVLSVPNATYIVLVLDIFMNVVSTDGQTTAINVPLYRSVPSIIYNIIISKTPQ